MSRYEVDSVFTWHGGQLEALMPKGEESSGLRVHAGQRDSDTLLYSSQCCHLLKEGE